MILFFKDFTVKLKLYRQSLDPYGDAEGQEASHTPEETLQV